MRKIFILLIMVIVFSSCGSSNRSDDSYEGVSGGTARYSTVENYETQSAYDNAMPMPEEAPMAGGGPSGSSSDTLMFIKTANINLRTDSFDTVLDSIRATVTNYGGYYESSNQYTSSGSKSKYRIYNATIRVPVEEYETVKAIIENSAVLEMSTESSKEVSGEYFNTKSRLETLKVEEERLIEFIEQASDLEQVIEFEKRLTDVRNQIDIYEASLSRLESLTSYSTIVVNITETQDIDEPYELDFFGRVKKGFIDSAKATLNFIQNIFIFIAYIIVPLMIIGILVLAGFMINKRRKRKKSERDD